jgi:hypothetical protein
MDAPPSDLGGGPSAVPEPPKDDKPFDDTPFDAGVEADEESDPKKFIEQLTGKLGQSLRKYTEAQGQPDFELEKFAINSLLSATHTSEMDSEDQEDIIKKVKEAGKGDDAVSDTGNDAGNDVGNNGSTDDGNNDGFTGTSGENPPPPPAPAPSVAENKDDSFLIKPKKLSIFAPEGSEEANYKHKIVEKLHETLNQEDMTEPMVEPQVKPAPAEPKRIETEPMIAPSRKNKPFLPMPNVKPDPKAKK